MATVEIFGVAEAPTPLSARFALFGVSAAAAVAVLAFLVRLAAFPPPQAALVALMAAFSYPLAGALVIGLLTYARAAAYPARLGVSALSTRERILLATVWPLYLVYALVVYPFMIIVNRVF